MLFEIGRKGRGTIGIDAAENAVHLETMKRIIAVLDVNVSQSPGRIGLVAYPGGSSCVHFRVHILEPTD